MVLSEVDVDSRELLHPRFDGMTQYPEYRCRASNRVIEFDHGVATLGTTKADRSFEFRDVWGVPGIEEISMLKDSASNSLLTMVQVSSLVRDGWPCVCVIVELRTSNWHQQARKPNYATVVIYTVNTRLVANV